MAQDYALAAGDPSMKELAAKGIALTNYHAVTHPSEPNYAAVVAGDYFGMDNDDFIDFPKNISTVVDLLDTKGISFATYQEHIPETGFLGFNYSNQKTFANDYVRKHNPFALFDSITTNATRLSSIKSFVDFNNDVANETLPQWSFITPNMTNDGHDTTVTFAASWAKTFLTPLLNNTYVMDKTLIILTFDEVETYTSENKVFTVLLGGAIPPSLQGTTDDTFYNHFSTISTVSANWGLPSLGRWDCGANVLEIVANVTGHTNAVVDTTGLYFNSSYPGPVSNKKYIPFWPIPDTTAKCASGLGVLSSIASTWGSSSGTYNYTSPYNYDDASGNNVSPVSGSPGSNTSTATGSTPTPSTSHSGASSIKSIGIMIPVIAGLVAAVMA